MKEDLEPLLALPAPCARSCPSATRVPNATWGAGRRAAGGGPGSGGSLRPESQRSTAGSPDQAASRRKPQGSPSMTRERSLKRSGDQPGPGTLNQRRHLRLGSCRWRGGREALSLSSRSSCHLAAPNNVHSKYRPVSLKLRFRTCRPDAATEPVAVNVWGLPASFRLGGVCLPQKAA